MLHSTISLFLTCPSGWVKKSFLLIGLLAFSLGSKAQVNFVLNSNFEQYSRCPYEYDQIKFANFWSAIDTLNHPPIDSFGTDCAPEYCNECAGINGQTGVPSNDNFYHYARTGKGMAQMDIYFDQSFPLSYQVNYLQGRLYHSLIAGQSYCVTFFVCLELASEYAINNIGAFLDNGSIDTTQNCGLPQTTHIPQVVENSVILDSLNWTKVEGQFIASGTEDFITIGNFAPYAQTNAVRLGTAFDAIALYLVDDVSVVESNTPAYAGGNKFKSKYDSVFIGRQEMLPDCEWYRDGVLIDTFHSGFWVHDTVNTTYVVKQDFCGNVLYDTAQIIIVPVGVGSVGNAYTFKLYPNPATKEITIQTVNDRSTAALAIYDMSGRVMLRQDVQFVGGTARVPIDLVGGVYMVELVDGNGGRVVERLSVL